MAAHRWVAVSDGYAWEICTDMGGKGLAPTLNEQSWKVNGVVNGIDYAEWSPHLDAHLDPAEGYQQFPCAPAAPAASSLRVLPAVAGPFA